MNETKNPKNNDAVTPLYRVNFVYTNSDGLLRNSQYIVPAASIPAATEIVTLKLQQRFFGTTTHFRIGAVKLF